LMRHLALFSSFLILFSRFRDHLALHSFPTRRSSDLLAKSEAKRYLEVICTKFRSLEHFYPAFASEVSRKFQTALLFLDQMEIKIDRKSTRLNSSHVSISYAVFCLKKKK